MSFSHGWGQSWLGPCPLLTPRLSEFGLIWAIHSISTLQFCHHKYDEWFCKVEIWIHHPHPMPHPDFWVTGGDNFGSSIPYVSYQDGVCFDWFVNVTASQPFQCLIISILNGWRRLRLVYVLYNGHHNMSFSHGWGQSRLGPYSTLPPRLSEFGLIWAFHSISTLPFSHHES